MNALANLKEFINKEQVYIWLISSVLISLPLKHHINSLLIFFLFLYAVLFSILNKGTTKFEISTISIPLVLIYILALVSLIWTINTQKSLEGLTQKFSYLLIPLIFILIPRPNQNKVSKIYYNFSIATFLYAIYCMSIGIFLAIKNGNIDNLFYHNLSKPLSDINAIYMSMFTAFALLYIFTKKEKKRKDFIYLLVLSIFLILLSSKLVISITILLIVSSVFFSDRKVKNKFTYPLLVISVLILAILLSGNIIKRFNTETSKTHLSEVLTREEFGQNYYWTGTSLRLFQIRAFVELLSEDNLILKGYGLDASQSMLKKKYKQYNLYSGYYHYDFHNQYLQIFSDLGLLGFLLLLIIFYLCLKEALTNRNFFFFSFIFLIIILCMTESYLWRQRGMVFFITVALLFYNESIKSRYIEKALF